MSKNLNYLLIHMIFTLMHWKNILVYMHVYSSLFIHSTVWPSNVVLAKIVRRPPGGYILRSVFRGSPEGLRRVSEGSPDDFRRDNIAEPHGTTYIFLTWIVLFRRNTIEKWTLGKFVAQFYKRIYIPIYPWAHRDCTYVSQHQWKQSPFPWFFGGAAQFSTYCILLLLYPTSKQKQRPRMDLEKKILT